MFYFLYGPDTFRARQKLNEIILHYKSIHKSGLNFVTLDCSRDDFEDFRRVVETVSMFNEKRLIIITDAFSCAPFQEKFLTFLKGRNPSDDKDTIVIFFEGDLSSRASHPFFKALKEAAKVQEFKLLKGAQFKKWLTGRIKEKGITIDIRAFEAFLDAVGDDTWRAASELNKLYAYADGGAINDESVRQLVAPKTETNIFATIDAFAMRDKRRALRLIREHLDRGATEAYLISMLTYQIRNLLIMKGASEKGVMYRTTSLQKTFGLHPYVIRKSDTQARKFTIEELKKIYRALLEVDLDMKLGRRDARVGLELLVANLS